MHVFQEIAEATAPLDESVYPRSELARTSLLTLLGAGSLLGTFGNAVSQLLDPATIAGAASDAAADVDAPSQAEVVSAGQSAASYAVLGLGLTIIASALGGVVGSKFWPRQKDADATATAARR